MREPTEGEVSEAFQMAALKQYPIIYLVQDNGWDISANAKETRAQDISEYIKGFHGIEARTIDGTDFWACYQTVEEVIATVRKERRPFLIHAKVPLLGHHTSGVRKEWYRDDLEEAAKADPYPKLRAALEQQDVRLAEFINLEAKIRKELEPFTDVTILFVSALTKQRLLKALEETVKVYENRKQRIPTSKFNDFMLKLIEAYPPPALKGKYVKIKYCMQLPTPTPQFVFFANLPQYVKDPYKRFIENKLRENYNFSGVPIDIYFRQK